MSLETTVADVCAKFGGAPPAEKCQGAITRRATDVLGGHKKESVMVAIRPGAKGERAKGGSFGRDGELDSSAASRTGRGR